MVLSVGTGTATPCLSNLHSCMQTSHPCSSEVHVILEVVTCVISASGTLLLQADVPHPFFSVKDNPFACPAAVNGACLFLAGMGGKRRSCWLLLSKAALTAFGGWNACFRCSSRFSLSCRCCHTVVDVAFRRRGGGPLQGAALICSTLSSEFITNLTTCPMGIGLSLRVSL